MVGTIAEAAAAARAAADHVTPHPLPAVSSDEGRKGQHRSDEGPESPAGALPIDTVEQGHRAETDEEPAERGDGAGATVDVADKTAAHLILAGRAYAYGRSIVEANPEAKKHGETVAIES